jgi:alginate O-acetyltransferase complex protein AlgI
MVFSSLLFLFFFLPLTLLFYYLGPKKLRNFVLLIMSLLFYAWGEPVYVFLMIFSAIVDYIHGRVIHHYRIKNPFLAKLGLLSSLVVNILILSFFKYADFLIENINLVLGTSIASLDLPLPIGISFYTFQTMSYCIDIYRGKVVPQNNPIALATYVTLFPQLIAGPIVRYESIADELHNRVWNKEQFAEGVRIFIIGLGKKVLLANNIGLLWSTVENQQTGEISLLTAWLGIIAFGFQLYFDFSGYSDMAIGLGKMFGFTFPQNFNYPFISKNVTEFWRRWHMTLGSWFRDYVYIPLGGNRGDKWAVYRNLFLVWFLTGLWHGASWNYVIWGLYFGFFIALEKGGFLTFLEKLPKAVQHLYLLVILTISWVFFVFEDVSTGFHFLRVMFSFSFNPFIDSQFLYLSYTNLVLFVICCIAATQIPSQIGKLIVNSNLRLKSILVVAFYVFILMLSTAYLVDESYNPFLYFRF